MRRMTRLALWFVAGLLLATVLLAYQNPHLAVDLANQLWSCF
ncbi:hypothetical protein [Aquabacterium sp. OR-4]|nr:hypothetical protein [Aquabacterium sp. OR-4]MDT7835233.1 hypothetical protein [Aquabacterium sp. OR-4]